MEPYDKTPGEWVEEIIGILGGLGVFVWYAWNHLGYKEIILNIIDQYYY